MGLYFCPVKCCCGDFVLKERLNDDVSVLVHQVDPYEYYLVELKQFCFAGVDKFDLGTVRIRVPFNSVEKVIKLRDSWGKGEDSNYFPDMLETYPSHVCSADVHSSHVCFADVYWFWFKCAICGLELNSSNRSETSYLCLECCRELLL